jgi:hypothetical protein
VFVAGIVWHLRLAELPSLPRTDEKLPPAVLKSPPRTDENPPTGYGLYRAAVAAGVGTRPSMG